jgi:predicted metalloprotease
MWQPTKNDGKPAFIEPGDVEAALRTAAAIGDDTLQRKAQGQQESRITGTRLASLPSAPGVA